MKKSIEIFGWYGVVAILAAYALISFSVFDANNFWYQILNVTGSAGLTAVALTKKDTQLVLANGAWAVIALVILIKIIF
jgi:hypothetical protein